MGVPDVTARLDPRYATDAFSTRIGRLIYPALIDFDKSSIPSPWIAKYWEWLDEVTLSVEINNNLVSISAIIFCILNHTIITYNNFCS